ncbi:CamS family sex pheromone protein [Lentibacillus saliphilus]|uniref:CamS family sex pheromone protein n=1 Tax=Lentibacillus saliphilus TaxID=2737028 RepID=UPI001C31000B|nr:CamS family sex pheromone protein [Lentibacillus saliphilus]
MKKLAILCGIALLISGCTPDMNKEDEVVQKEDENKGQPSIVTSYQLSDENYRTILPYEVSEARGVITGQIANRVDIDEMEQGLRRLSKAYFDPKKYYFEEGRYITKNEVIRLIDELNPEKDPFKEEDDVDREEKEEYQKENPRYLSHILEQNYIKRNEDNTVEVVGVSIGIALKSVYHFSVDGYSFQKDLKHKEAIAAGKKHAQSILEYLRGIDELADVPIMIALYEEADQGSPVPGSYQALTYAEPPGMMVDKWEALKEETILFPSKQAEEKYFDDYQLMKRFGEGVAEFFPNYVGYVGEGFYIDENLKRLTIEIPISFYGKGEVIGFTQYVYGLVKETFSSQYELEIKITSDDDVESIISRPAGEDDPDVYISH